MIFLKTPNTNKSVSKTAYKTKVTRIENKISSISCSVAKCLGSVFKTR